MQAFIDAYLKSVGAGGLPQPYTLPIATENRLGGVKPITKTEIMVQPVGVDENGRLFAKESEKYTLPIATNLTLGGVKPVSKTSEMTQPVGVDANGRLYVNGDAGLNINRLTLETNKSNDKVTLTLGDGNNSKSVDIPMVVDNSLDTTSTNPVQNMVVAQELRTLQEDIADIKQNGVGGEAGVVIRLTNQNGSSSLISSYGSPCQVMFAFSSTEDDIPTGNGTCEIKVGGATKVKMSIPQGLNVIDIAPYLNIGDNTVIVTVTDVFGKARSLSYSVTQIQLIIESKFDATVPYYEDILFKYTPHGAIEKTIHFVIDGVEVGTVITSLSGKQMTRTIPYLPHGVHTLEVYSTAKMNETDLESPRLKYDIICLDEDNTAPMIASVYNVETVSQGEQVSIPYIVYDPTKLACDIELTIFTMESGREIVYNTQNITVDRSQNDWNTRKYPIGEVYFRIKYGDITKTHCIHVEETKIQIEAETTDLELHLSSEGRSNNETNPNQWVFGENVTTTFSNMNWKSVGWVNDENGDACLRLNGDARATINFMPFDNDIRTYGKTLEFEFTIRDVNNRDAIVISCMSGGLGFEIKPDTAYIVSEQSRVFCNYKDDDNDTDNKIEKVRVSFVIEAKSEHRILAIYLNGVLSDVMQYPETDNFQQLNPVAISIGSSECGIDLYNIRSYSTALSSQSIMTNYHADMADVVKKTESYEENDVYDAYGNISFLKAKEKNSVMVIVGNLPQSKGDKKKVRVYYEDVEDSSLNFDQSNIDIDVQGTSSQWYVRKNWKIKFTNDVTIAVDQLSGKVVCIKVDYAEATGTHNTQNAVFVERLYEEKIPPQEVDPKVRTTIYGKPILLFHQKDANSEPEFYGKANYNWDKGAENVFGFTSAYDVECWEFKNNTSDACNFLGPFPENWEEDFEARYPEKSTNITRLKQMHDWVVSTKDNVTKFKNEFENYFNLHYALVYYTYTFFTLMVDQRAKNMFPTYWAKTGKWYFYFYDSDTCFGINNEGQLVFDYYHEDTDTLDGANVYNGQNSTLWKNFRIAYADEIKAMWQKWRSDGLITFDLMEEQFITKGSDKWSESIYNEDTEFKYVSMLKTDNDASNLPFARGDGEQHFRYFVANRLNYCDSKWYATDYANDYVSLRIYTPIDANGNPRTDLAVPANADITVTPYSNMYAGVRYKANGSLFQERATHSVPVTFDAPNEVFNDTETAIYGASQLSSLGDLAPLYCGTVNVAKATKLTEIKIGDGTVGYVNNNLKELSVGTNKLLKKIDIQNCPSFNHALGLKGCQNIEEIYAKGSGITGVELADSGYLKIVQLPSTIANLTMKNQLYIEEFTMEGYNALKTLHIENCPAINTLDIIDNAPNLERVRLTGVNWTYDDTSFLYELMDRDLAGIDENGANTDNMWVDGACHIGSLTGAEFAEIKAMYPYLTITYDNLESQLIYVAPVFMSCSTDENGVLIFDGNPTVDEDGVLILSDSFNPPVEEDGTLGIPTEQVWLEVYRETIINGGNGSDPVSSGEIETPDLLDTAQYDYTFNGGWSLVQGGDAYANALLNVEGDRTVYASFNKEIKKYTVKFYSGTTLLETQTIEYGSDATYGGATPTHPSGEDYYEFIGWSPTPTNIQGKTDCYAQFYDTRVIEDDWETISVNCNNGTATDLYPIGASKPVTITYEDGTSETINFELIAHNHDELAGGLFKWEKLDNMPIAITHGSIVAYNNEIHAMGGPFASNNDHYKYDGTEWTKVGTTPLGMPSAVVYNNEIHIINGTHYKWDATNSEWIEVSTPIYMGYSQVVYNNEIHVLGGSSSAKVHYKWDGSSWVEVGTLPVNHYGVAKAVVYNNEIHLVGTPSPGSYYDHYKWDGTSWTKVSTVPIQTNNGSAIVYNDEIHILVGNNHYKWDGNEWHVASNFSGILATYTYGKTVVYNNEIHLLATNKQHFKWSTTSWVEAMPRPHDYSGNLTVFNSELYVICSAHFNGSFKKWNGESWDTLTTAPFVPTWSVVYNNEIHIFREINHAKWNGTEWISDVSTLPVNIANPVVYNNEIHICVDNSHYKWNGSGWTSVSTLPYTLSGGTCVVYNNEIHIMGGNSTANYKKHYKWNGSEWMQVSVLPYEYYKGGVVIHNGELHIIGGARANTGTKHYKWNETEWKEVSVLCIETSNSYGYNAGVSYRGKLYILASRTSFYVYQNPKATLTFFAKNLLKDNVNFNKSQITWNGVTGWVNGGWAMSYARTYFNETIINALPNDLSNAIKQVIKLSNVGSSNNILSSEDKLWMISSCELGMTELGQGKQYPVFTDGISRIKAKVGQTSNEWITRSTDNVNFIRSLTVGGGPNTKGGASAHPTTFGFCI